MPRRGPYAGRSPLAMLRERLGMTLAEAARRSGLSREYLNRVETGGARPRGKELARLATLYRLPVGEVRRLSGLAAAYDHNSRP